MGAQALDDPGEHGGIVQVRGGQVGEDRLASGVELARGQCLAQQEDGHRVHALEEIRAGGLAGGLGVGGEVDDVVGELEGDADALAELLDDGLDPGARTGEHGAVAGGDGDKRAGLVREHLDVVVNGVGARGATEGLVELAGAQALEGPRVGEGRLGPESGDELGGAGHEDVAREDGRRVAPDGLGAGGAAPQRGVVHDVVVVERGDMRELDGDARVPHRLARGALGVPELGGEQHKGGAQTLAAGPGQVGGGRVDGLVSVADDHHEPLLHGVKGGGHAALEFRGAQWQRCGHGMSIAARSSVVSTAWGRTPRAIVARTAMVIAAAAMPWESTTATPSPSGSRKYMSTTSLR